MENNTMSRENIFLHFLKPDNIDLYAEKVGRNTVSQYYNDYYLVETTLRYAFMLTKDYCLLPPAFIIESEYNFNLIKKYQKTIETNLLKFIIREPLFDLFIEKKLKQYTDYKLLNDKFGNYNFNYLKRIAQELEIKPIKKHIKIGQNSAKLWNEQINDIEKGEFDFLKRLYDYDPKNIKTLIKALNIDIEELHEKAFVWEVVEEKLKRINFSDKETKFKLHGVLQKYYITSNIENENWQLVSSSPLFNGVDFNIKTTTLKYDFNAFKIYLEYLGVSEIIDKISVDSFVRIRKFSEYVDFIEMFDFLVLLSDNNVESFKTKHKSLFEKRKIKYELFKEIVKSVFTRKLEDITRITDFSKRINSVKEKINIFKKNVIDNGLLENPQEFSHLLSGRLDNLTSITFNANDMKFDNSTFQDCTFNEYNVAEKEIFSIINNANLTLDEKKELISYLESIKKGEKDTKNNKLVEFLKGLGINLTSGIIASYMIAKGL